MTADERSPEDQDEARLQEQYLRALSSFEGIVLSQIDVKNKLGDRLNYSIRSGLIILSMIAFSILVLLLSLSAQITRISDVVAAMNTHFTSVSDKMDHIRDDMSHMEQRIALMETMQRSTDTLTQNMSLIADDMSQINQTMLGTSKHLAGVRVQVSNIATGMDRMNGEVQSMSYEMNRLAKPARAINKLFPFP